jgi:hypothetical protein
MIRTAHRHATWWKAPLLASLLGLPFLVLEYRWFASHQETGAFGGVLYWAGALLLFAWALPHRLALRATRMTAAGAGLGFALLPMLWVTLASAATSGS